LLFWLPRCNKGVSAAVIAQGTGIEVAMKYFLVVMGLLLTLAASIGMAGNWIPAPQGSPVGLMQRLDRAKWIGTGAKSAERVVYVFTDPDCPFCNDLWKAMQKARAPEVQIRYLLVAVIDADSKGKDAAILEAKDPVAAFEQTERNYDHGGIAPKKTALPETTQTIGFNGDLMGALHIFGTPGLVYQDEHGQVKVYAGMPDATQLAAIVGKR
jgi:protein-disulfide isomerase